MLDALRNFYETDNANPHRGAYALSVAATDAYDDARQRLSRFLGVADPDCLIFTRGTTESFNLVVTSWGRTNLRAGDEIVVTAWTITRILSPGSNSRSRSGPGSGSVR